MSISISNAYTGSRALESSTRALSASSSSSAGKEDTGRAQQLTQQLENNLSSRLSRIREQIGTPGVSSPSSTASVGQTLDIQA